MQRIVRGDISPRTGFFLPTASVWCLSVSLLAAGAMPATAQAVDHDRIEALFAILNAPRQTPSLRVPAPTVLGLPSVQPTTPETPPQMTGPTLPGDAPQPSGEASNPTRGSELFAYETPQGSDCPRSSAAFAEAVSGIETASAEIGRKVRKLEEGFDELAENMIRMRGAETFECSKALKSEIETMSDTIAEFDAAERMARVENLGTCAQQAATRIGQAMEDIPMDAPRDLQLQRSNLSRQLNNASLQDSRLTSVMIAMASMRQKQIRLSEAVSDFRAECVSSSEDIFGGDLTDYQ